MEFFFLNLKFKNIFKKYYYYYYLGFSNLKWGLGTITKPNGWWWAYEVEFNYTCKGSKQIKCVREI
jgi:hypothetical protein